MNRPMSAAFTGDYNHIKKEARLLNVQECQFRIWHLEQVGLELFSMQKYQAALVHFKEAFQALSSFSDTLNQQQHDESYYDDQRINYSLHYPNNAFFFPPQDLFQPLIIDFEGQNPPLEEVKLWIHASSLCLLYNGALAQFSLGRNDDAEQLLSFAVAVADKEEYEENLSHPGKMFFVNRCLFAVNVLQAKLKSCDIYHSQCDGSNTQEVLEEVLDAFSRSLDLAEELWGPTHFIVATVYCQLGHFLMRHKYIQGASFAFEAADAIYNMPRIPKDSMSTHQQNESWISDEMSDFELSMMLLGHGSWGVAAPAA